MIKKIIKKIISIFGYNISKIDKKYKKLSFNDIHKLKIDIDNPLIFDVGANKGQSIRRFKKIFPKSIIHAFEPIKEEFVKLEDEFKNDINFRNEILSLAESYPEIEFIFRGKNCNWLKNKHHHQVISKADKLPNVSVDTDYSLNHWQSYHLCVSADLIIARPTSIAEECISKGMNVIVMDYGINYTITVSEFLPRLLREYYCHSFYQLNEMFKFWSKNKFIISKEKKNQVKKELFSNYTDGKVKDRIQRYLNEIYVQPKQNNNDFDSTKQKIYDII